VKACHPDAAWPIRNELADQRVEIEAAGLFEDVRVRQFRLGDHWGLGRGLGKPIRLTATV
jgi:hypothetical protein